jgi:redox-sensitive bicupin YhaK (pirin superfamily)
MDGRPRGAAVIRVLRAADRFETAQPGILTRHCFSAGAHYDPDNTRFGPLIGFDEHVVAPGAGFARHAHRGVDIVSWVLDGALRHQDGSGTERTVRPGLAQLQATGDGIEHTELNASATEPLRFLQMTVLAGVGPPRYALAEPPVAAAAGTLRIHRAGTVSVEAPLVHVYVVTGGFDVGDQQLHAGDSARADEPVTLDGTGELVVWELRAG